MLPRLVLVLALVLALGAPALAQTVERETATTADGATLVLRRLKVQGGVPVLLLHGLGSNGWEWDLPSKSFARALAAQGYDVWIANHRRTGKNGFRSDGPVGYSFDDLAALDMPALVEKVHAATGERPLLVGHSMGGMMISAWLAGAALESVVVRREPRLTLGGLRWQDVYGRRVTGDAGRAAARNSAIRGAVEIASPARFAWPLNDRATFFNFWRYDYWDYNILLRDLSWSPSSIAASYVFENVPSGEVTDFLTRDLVSLPYLGPQMRPYLAAVTAQIGRSYLISEIAYGPNMEGPVLVEGLRDAVDDCSGAVFRQLMDGIRTRSFREGHLLDTARSPYVYADHLDRVSAPILVVGGKYDKLCNDETLERDGFGRMGSRDKTYLGPLAYGHVDLVVGRDAPRDVWAPVLAWLAAHK